MTRRISCFRVRDQRVEIGRGQHGARITARPARPGWADGHARIHGIARYLVSVEGPGDRRRSAYASPDAGSAHLSHDRHGSVALRAGRGRPRPDAADAARRQAQGDRQGRAPAQEPASADRSSPSPSCSWCMARGRTFDVITSASGGRGLAAPARPARVDRHCLVPGRACRARRRGARRRISGLRPAAPRIPVARRRHGARACRALVRVRPGRRAGHAAGSRTLRRVRPRSRSRTRTIRWVPALGGVLCDDHLPPPAEQAPLSLGALKLLRAYRRLDIEAIAGLRLPRGVELGNRGRRCAASCATCWSASRARSHSSTRFGPGTRRLPRVATVRIGQFERRHVGLAAGLAARRITAFREHAPLVPERWTVPKPSPTAWQRWSKPIQPWLPLPTASSLAT